MNYFHSDDLDSICYVEKKTNNVVIKFIGFPNELSSELFSSYVMNRLGFDYIPNDTPHSKMIH
jgi:hypothetical protein